LRKSRDKAGVIGLVTRYLALQRPIDVTEHRVVQRPRPRPRVGRESGNRAPSRGRSVLSLRT
jgi:hypothetical protein